MCMHCLTSQKFLRILYAVVAETAESVPSYEAGWQGCLAVFPLLLPLGIVPSSARQLLGRLPTSSFVEAPKSEFIAVCRTVLSFRQRLGVFRVQTSSKTYWLLQLGSSRSQFWQMTSHVHIRTHTHSAHTSCFIVLRISVVLSYLLISYGCASSLLSTSLHSWAWSSHMQDSACSLLLYCAICTIPCVS